MKQYFRLFVLAMLFCAAAPAQNALQWQPLREPGSGGWITSFRISPHDGKRMVLGGDMLGAALSTDGGASWGPVFGFSSWEINDFTWHPTDANVVWCGSLMGPYKSSDGGRNFVAKRNGFGPRAGFGFSAPVECVLFDPNNAKRLLAFGGSSRGWDLPGQKPLYGAVWESQDGGESWTKIATIGADGNTSEAEKGVNIYGAEFATGSSSVLYAVAPSAGFFASSDGGKTWQKRVNGLPHSAAARVQVHPREANTLWISLLHAKKDGKSLPGGVFKSTDSGQSWQSLSNGLSQKSDDKEINFTASYAALAVAPSNPSVMYTADGAWNTGVIYVSRDGGQNWRAAASKQNVDVAMPAGLAGTYFAVDPKNADVAFNLGSEHIIATRDGGQTWRDEGNDKQPDGGWQGRGFSGWCSINARFNPYKKGQLVLQAMDAARVLITDDGASWKRPLVQPDPWGGGDDVTFTPGGHIYATTGQHGSFQGIARSTDGGKSWQMLHGAARGLPEAGWGKGNAEASGIYALPDAPNKVWACLGGKLYRSTDGGEKWTTVEIGSGLKWLAADPKNGSRFFVSGAKNVFFTTDGGETWQGIGGPRKAGRMTVDALGRLYIAADEGERGGLWRWDEKAEPNTSKWTRLWDDGWILNVAVDPNNPSRLAITTNQNPYVEVSKASGVWISGDAGATWTQANDNLPMLRGHAIAFNPFDSEELVHGTFGRGFFKARWPQNFVPQGGKSYRQTAADTAFAQRIENEAPPAKNMAAKGEITRLIRDFGPTGFDYAYGAWKSETLKPSDAFVSIDANEAGGAGIVLNGADIAPQKQTHLALRAKLLPGNGAARLNVNLKGPEKTVSFDLTKLNANDWTTLLEPLGEGQFNNVLQVQIQGTNWSAAAQPLKIQIDAIGTTSTDEKANAAIKTALANDPTAGPPPKDKPIVPGWGFYPQFPQAWMQTHNGFVQRTKENAQKSINVVFFGDSITQGWGGAGKEVWDKNYAPLGAVNYGIGGDGTRQVLYRILNGEVDGISPKLVVLKIGTNNLYGDFNAGSDEEIADGIQKIVATLREKLPKTKILLLGILPRQNDYFSSRTKHINELIKPLGDGQNVRFLDMSDQFQTAIGKVKPELYVADQLHLAKPGYELWAAAMKPLFEEMLKP